MGDDRVESGGGFGPSVECVEQFLLRHVHGRGGFQIGLRFRLGLQCLQGNIPLRFRFAKFACR